MTPKTFAVQRLPKPSAPEHHDFNEAPGNPFTFEMEIPEWLMESLGAGPKTGSFVNHSVLDFSSSVWRRLLSLCLCTLLGFLRLKQTILNSIQLIGSPTIIEQFQWETYGLILKVSEKRDLYNLILFQMANPPDPYLSLQKSHPAGLFSLVRIIPKKTRFGLPHSCWCNLWIGSLLYRHLRMRLKGAVHPSFGHDSAVDAMKSTHQQIGSFEAQANNSDTGYS